MRPLALVALVAACSSEPPRAAAPPPVEEEVREMPHAWKGHVLDVDGAELTFKCCDGDGSRPYIGTKGFRKGTQLTVGETTWEPDRSTGDRQQVDIAPYLGELDLLAERSELALQVPVKVQIPGPWKPIETVSPAAKVTRHQGAMVLKRIVEQPLPFRADVDHDPVDTAFLVDLIRPPSKPVRGAGKKLADVDWVAISTWKPTGQQKKCGGYSRTPGVRGNETVTIGLNDIELTVYERRSGKVLGKKTFPSRTACPDFARAGADGIGPAEEPIVAWLDAAIARGSLE